MARLRTRMPTPTSASTPLSQRRPKSGAGRRRARGERGLRHPEVLAKGLHLALVVRADAGAVEDARGLEHALEGELADRLAVLDHERHVVGAHLERRSGTVEAAVGVEAEAGVEEAGV